MTHAMAAVTRHCHRHVTHTPKSQAIYLSFILLYLYTDHYHGHYLLLYHLLLYLPLLMLPFSLKYTQFSIICCR